MKDSFEISLEYIDHLYQLKGYFREDFSIEYRNKLMRLRGVFEKTQDEIGYILGRRNPHKEIFRYNQLREKDPFDLTEEEEREFEELGRNLKVQVYLKFNELMETVPSPIEDNPFIPNLSRFPDYIDEISSIRLDPLKMIFNVWHRHFKRVEYSSIKSIKKKMFEYKKKFENTDKEYLFKSLKEDTSFESLRKKSLYNLKPPYDNLAEFIYRKSFEGK